MNFIRRLFWGKSNRVVITIEAYPSGYTTIVKWPDLKSLSVEESNEVCGRVAQVIAAVSCGGRQSLSEMQSAVGHFAGCTGAQAFGSAIINTSNSMAAQFLGRRPLVSSHEVI